MRKITFTIIGLFLGLLSLKGNNIQYATTTNQGFNYRYSQPIQFETRGIKYFVFPDGRFEFTRVGKHYRFRQGRYLNRSVRVLGNRSRYSPYYGGMAVVRNRYGDIIRIGRTPILYDYEGRVKRIGPVAMNYGRFGLLRRIGDMQVRYNPRGKLVYAQGHVVHNYCGICGAYGCSINHFDTDGYAYSDNRNWDKHYKRNDWDDDDWDDDDWDDDYKNKRKKRKYHKFYDD